MSTKGVHNFNDDEVLKNIKSVKHQLINVDDINFDTLHIFPTSYDIIGMQCFLDKEEVLCFNLVYKKRDD